MFSLTTQKREINKQIFSVTYAVVEENNQKETVITVSEWLGDKVEKATYGKILSKEEIDKKINKMVDTLIKPKKTMRSWFRR